MRKWALYGPYVCWWLYGTYMDDKRLEIRVSSDLLAQVERARGELSRSAFVKAAVRRHLGLLKSPDVMKMTQVLAESVPSVSVPPPRVVPAPAVQVPSSVADGDLLTGGCPECAGVLVRRDGRWVCGDCGWSKR